MEGTMAALTPNAGRQSARKLYMYTAKNPVFAPAKQYADLGFKLVAWHGGNPVSKFPKRQGWGIKPLDPSTINGEDMIGLNHGLSHTVVIDGDDLPLTRKVFDEIGLDVDAMPGDPPSYCGNPERLKWIYRLPEGFTPPGVKKLSGTVNGKHTTVFELRGCAEGTQAQDVLPPSRHPTGGSYEWINPLVAYDQLPELPADLADLWTRWDTVKDQLGVMAGFDLPPKPEPQAPATPHPSAIRGDSVIEAFNAANRIENIIERHGYRPKEGKWLAPQSTTGDPGITIDTIDGKQRLYSHHGTDPLSASNHGGHALDAFAVYQVLEGGSVKAAASELGMGKPPPGNSMPRNGTPDEVRQERAPCGWPELVDPFAEYPCPHFPVDILPKAFRTLIAERSAQSGFDPGGYAFCLLVAASHIVDHRCRLDLGPFKVPAYLWGAVVGASGSGKSPIIGEGRHASCEINDALLKKSGYDYSRWVSMRDEAKSNKETEPEKPKWKQRIALDTTVEALGGLLVENPEGINLYFDEMSEFLGRMDAYSGKDGGKDRATYLRAYDGGQVTINRSGKPALVVPEFSVGILCGVQPQLLADKFRQSGGGSDGLYQRFLMYCLQEAGEVDYSAMLSDDTQGDIANLFAGLDSLPVMTVSASSGARGVLQGFHNNMRKLSKRTPAHRFAEHLDKYPGFFGRLGFTLHLLDSVENGTDPARMVTAETMQNAQRIMGGLYRHSEAVYAVLDREAGDVRNLVQSAAEAILSKGWTEFSRGDLTRDATYWRKSDRREAESAIDHLIELGWIADVTPTPEPGKRGRPTAGKFIVHPSAHLTFSEHAERVRQARSERFEAITAITRD